MDENQRGVALPHGPVPRPPPPPPLDRLVALLSWLGVEDPICMLRKQVDKSDADSSQCRLQLTYELARDFVESDDLTADEKERVRIQEHGVLIEGYDRDGNGYGQMKFSRVTRIGMNGQGTFRLRNFGKFASSVGLVEGHTVVAWVFRLPLATQPAPGRSLAMVLLNYTSMDPDVVDEMVAAEEQALDDMAALHGLRKLKASDE